MPIYDFTCDACGHAYESLVARIGAKAPCPQCGSERVSRGISCPAAPRVRGSGPESAGGACPAAGGGG
jgi:putative FmdB family regulatory protein